MYKRICNSCNIEKPISEFHKNSSGKYGVSQRCKICMNTFAKQYRKDYHTKYYAAKYKTNESTIEKILETKVCSICGAEPKENKRHAIDHCHTTGKIRGLLCDACNTGLGKFKDSKILLEKAINYLNNAHD